MKFECAGLNQSAKLKESMNKAAQQVKQATKGACDDAAAEIVRRGRADIAGAGRFGSRWTDALHAQVQEQENKLEIQVSMTGGPPVAYWKIFEYGATISAKNASGMMWIPFQEGNTTWPRDYGGSLFRIGNALFDSKTREPMYLGTPSVTIDQKFHLRDIVAEVAKEMKQFYSLHMR